MKIKLTLFLATLLLAGCSTANATPAAQSTVTPSAPQAAPSATAAAIYPGPETTQPYPPSNTITDPAYPSSENNSLLPAAPATPIPSSYPGPDGGVSSVQALPNTSRYGVDFVDKVLDSLLNDKGGSITSLVSYIKAPCTTKEGLGGPPKCAAGEADGTQLDVLPVLGMEGGFIRKSDTVLNDLPGQVELLGIFAVKTDFKPEQYYPAGNYGIVLRVKSTAQMVVLRVTSAGIVRKDLAAAFPDNSSPDLDTYIQPK
jgi:hypothetical protein